MPPETIIGQPADVRSDIYSFGATLYFSWTGHLPFEDDNSLDLLAAHVNRPLTPMSLGTSAPIPLALEQVVRRCMAKDPRRRYPSTRAVSAALCRSVVHAPLAERASVGAPGALRNAHSRAVEVT
jgi:eukaryotic-like serine/threonine-protein kinase